MIVIQSFAKKILLTGALLALLPAGYAWADTYSGMGSALEDALEEELEMDKELDEAIEDLLTKYNIELPKEDTKD